MTDGSVVVVGGGSTGTGVARDLAMRGLDVTLVERGTLTHGTTGRMHGLLHSGGRYAVTDPDSAAACAAENRILREIAGPCVEPTGGLFVQRPEDDDDDYFERKLRACRDAGVPAEVLPGAEVRAAEPALADDVERAIAVPDAAVDPFRLCVANARGAENDGARIETHAEVTGVLTDGDAVTGVRVRHRDLPDVAVAGASRTQAADGRPGGGDGRPPADGTADGGTDPSPGDVEEIRAAHVVNATGAWAGRVAAMAGVDVAVRQSKGAMVVTDCRQVDTVVNRCRPKSDADIVVPHETTAVLGTTDVEVEDPDDFPEERWEVDLLIEELSSLVPALRGSRTIRSFWGVRPLYEPPGTAAADSREATRDFFVLDHADRDGVAGLTSVVGGKLTTYRLMAERVADRVCGALGVDARCRTAEVPLPGSEDPAALDAAMTDYGLRSPVTR